MSKRRSKPDQSTADRFPDQPPPAPAAKLPLRRKILFALLTTAVFFVLVEAVLRLAGVASLLLTEDPFVGFAGNLPLFVPQTGPDGTEVMRTADNKQAAFNLQVFPRRKTTGTYRIFSLGGSATYGHPYTDPASFSGWLRELLPVADPSRRWEVVNAGGISYASYRVTLLMQELARYEPDMFIIYSGHNEFLERRTYGDLMERSPVVTALVSLLSRTSTYSALKRGYDRVAGRSGGARKDGRNLLPAEVDEILNHSVGPSAYTRDDHLRDQIIEHYRVNLTRMVDIARAAGAVPVMVTPASNLKDCSPFKSEHLVGLSDEDIRRFDDLYRQAADQQKQGRDAEALALLAQAAKIDDRYAGLCFLKGGLLYKVGQYEQARRAFEQARDEDICPLRATTKMIQVVRQVAADRKVPLLDFVDTMDRLSEHGIPGEPYFLDHVHLTIEGYRLLALELIDLFKEQKIVQIAPAWNQAAIDKVKEAVEKRINEKDHAKALVILSKVLDWAGKFDEAGRLVAKASQTLGDDPDVLYGMALRAEHAGNTEEQMRYLQQLLAIMPTNVKAHLKMGLILESRGRLDEAAGEYRKAILSQPDFAEAIVNLAGVLARQGKTGESAALFEEAIHYQPDLAKAHNNYALLLGRVGKTQQAMAQFAEAIRIEPTFADPHFNLAVLEAQQGLLPEASKHFAEALRLRPDLTPARQALQQIEAILQQQPHATSQGRN